MKKRVLACFLAAALLAGAPVTVKAEEETAVSAGTEESVAGTEGTMDTEEDTFVMPEEETPADEAEEAPEIQEEEVPEEINRENEAGDTEAKTPPELSYRVHVQTHGWQEMKHAGEASGTTGEAKRLEAIELSVDDSEYEGGIEYRTHVQSYGWQEWAADGALSGTTAKAKRLEAIQIRLTGELKEHYDIYYQVHAQSYGWLDWACNGEKAGTASFAKRLESIVIVLVEKGAAPPERTEGSQEKAYYAPQIQYQTHVQSFGWQTQVSDGAVSGTSGQGKRLEGIRINLYDTSDLGYEGGIEYQTHVQSYGWQEWAADGAVSGTTGQAKRLEAIRIRLTGPLAEHYDVYYRVHCQTMGWMGWAKNGGAAGTEGFAKRLEAIEIKLADKNAPDAPDMSGQAYFVPFSDSDLILHGRTQIGSSENTSIGDGSQGTDTDKEIQAEGNGAVLGNPEDKPVLSAFGITLNPNNRELPLGEIQYRVSSEGGNWTDWTSQGALAGLPEEGKYLEAIQIQLTDTLGKFYNVYYRTYIESRGWLGWTMDGNFAGIRDSDKAVKAIQVKIVAKTEKGPDINGSPYIGESGAGILANPCPDASYISSEFGGRDAPLAGASTNHKGRDYAAKYGTSILAATSGTVRKVDYNGARGNYVILDHGNGLATVYQHCSKIVVKQGDTVFVGAKIAEVGSTGISSGPHLHFEVWVNEVPVDPRWYL
ncbi:MAG: peptidoglycan DD-metalloendopeptidase family protein [Dorea sp.]|nr:peptidoglycan DD-metalloendopeptidase family protein [Dorea sp.]